MTLSLSEALALAREAHQGQTYDGPDGPEPYIHHPLRVMARVSPGAAVVALLHDVREDSDVRVDGLSPPEDEALELLTKRDGEPYAAYIDRILTATGPGAELAREVKVADLRENLAHAPGHTRTARYELALATLLGRS